MTNRTTMGSGLLSEGKRQTIARSSEHSRVHTFSCRCLARVCSGDVPERVSLVYLPVRTEQVIYFYFFCTYSKPPHPPGYASRVTPQPGSLWGSATLQLQCRAARLVTCHGVGFHPACRSLDSSREQILLVCVAWLRR